MNLSTLLAGGTGGVVFFAVWAYLIITWLFSGDFNTWFPFT